jgi:hypothetical protein
MKSRFHRWRWTCAAQRIASLKEIGNELSAMFNG